VDRDVPGAGWLTLPAHKYTIRTTAKESHAQVRIAFRTPIYGGWFT
jgi:hypothetical protein